MAFEMLQAVVGMAVVDTDFRKAILNGSRHDAIARFDLSHEERAAVLSIHAETLEQFAGQLDQWIMKQEARVEPLALELPALARVSPRASKSQRAAAPHDERSGVRAFVPSSFLGHA